MKTFEEVIQEKGAGTVYSGTNVNLATQGALLEWLFDLNICTGDDTTKFLRYYRRQLNMNYPLYLDYLKLEAVRSSMDPFVQELMTRSHEDEKSLSGTESSTGTSSVTGSGTVKDVADTTTVRTPDITVATSSSNTETRNLAGSSETDSTNHTEGQDDSKSRAVSIAYPEANLNSLPLGIDDMPTNIDYASSEQDSFGKKNTKVDATEHSESSTTDTGTVGNAGTGSSQETGTETTDYDGTNTRTSSDTREGETTESKSHSGTESNKVTENDEGRHESEADILPRAIKAVTTTNAIKWLVKSLQVCFDNFSEL